jgi:hypothetical protein
VVVRFMNVLLRLNGRQCAVPPVCRSSPGGAIAPAARATAILAVGLFACAWVRADATGHERCERDYAPKIGEAGKDVIWVPTSDALVRAMLEAAHTTADDYVIDLGSGDGKIPIAAARDFGARALGVEYNAQMVKLARCHVAAEKLSDRVEIRVADIFETDFSDASVLTLYLLTDLNVRLRPTILRMKPGTRVVSNRFKMGDWSPDQFVTVGVGSNRAYLWIVPAAVRGAWTFRERGGHDRFRIRFQQRYQEIEGEVLGKARRRAAVRNATLQGTQIRLTLIGHGPQPIELQGTVAPEAIELETQRDGVRKHYDGTRD